MKEKVCNHHRKEREKEPTRPAGLRRVGAPAALVDSEYKPRQQLGHRDTQEGKGVVGWPSVPGEQTRAGSEISRWRAMLRLPGGPLGQGGQPSGLEAFPRKGPKSLRPI